MIFKEEQQYIDLKVKVLSVQARDSKFVDGFEAFVKNELESRQSLAFQNRTESKASGVATGSASISTTIPAVSS